MQSENRIFDDLAKVVNGIAGTVAGVGREAENLFKERTREWTGGADAVTREEFDAVKQMAAKARAQAEDLAKRVVALEAILGKKSAATPTVSAKAKPGKTGQAKTKSSKAKAK
jgi:BMFP domain-containing protein YqiC